MKILKYNNHSREFLSSFIINAALSIFSFFVFLFFAPNAYLRFDGQNYWHLADDPMITQRVSYNFWESGEPFFNAGEAIAANTSLFWPMTLSPLYGILSHGSVVLAVIIISASIYAATVFLAASCFSSTYQKIAVTTLIALSPSSLFYAASGWEHIPQAFLITSSFCFILAASKKAERLSVPAISLILVSLSFLLRVDSAPTIVVIFLAWFFSEKRFLNPGTYFLSAGLLTIPILYLVFMGHYYGDFIPNTAYLKLLPWSKSLLMGAKYIANPTQSGMVPAFLLVLLFAWKTQRPEGKLAISAALCHTVYLMGVGGDFFGSGRYFLIYLPIVSIVFVSYLSSVLGTNSNSRASACIATVFLIVGLWNAPYLVRSAIKNVNVYKDSSAVEDHIQIIHTIKKSLHPGDGSIGLHYLGVGYHLPNFHIVDFLGKAEPYIARVTPMYGPLGHNKWDYKYAFERYNIAAVPIAIGNFKAVTSPNYQLKEHYFMFWEIAALHMIKSGKYSYLPPGHFGVRSEGFGLFVRNDLLDRFQTKSR